MSLPNELHPLQLGAGSAAAYEIEQSLRFDGSSRLDFGSPTSQNVSALTVSCWVKVCMSNSYGATILDRYNAPNTANRAWLIYNAFGTNQFDSYYYTASINGRGLLSSQGRHRDPSAWQHVVFSFDNLAGQYSQKIFINGVDRTNNFSEATNGVVGFTFSSTYPLTIGWNSGEMYLAEYHLISGSQVNYDEFGEFDNNGVWRPIEYTGSYGTNGFYLKFDPTATNGIGHDHSGNGNNLTPSGFDTTNTGASTYDVMFDTPTTNYPTINTLAKLDPGETLNNSNVSNGNLEIDTAGDPGVVNNTVIANFQIPTSGKYYWEVTCREYSTAAPSRTSIGVMSNACALGPDAGDFVYADLAGVYTYGADGKTGKSPGLVQSTYGNTYGVNDVIGVAFDADNGDLYFYKNGTIQNSGTAAFTGLDMTDGFYPAVGYWGDFTFNFGQRAFDISSIPSGYKALNTRNLPAPTVKDGSKYFNTVTYAGNGGSNTITTGMDHSSGGGLLWIKNRTTTANHDVLDNVRGLDQLLELPATAAEYTYSSSNLAATSTGYTLNTSSGQFNASSNNYVAWNWLAGGSGSSNTDGTVTSTVSANPSAGFSIVRWSNQGTVGHGLGVAPSLIIVKSIDQTSGWWVYATALGNSNYGLPLHSSATQNTGINWGGAPTSTVFYISSGNGALPATSDNIAYCFAEVEGYSKIGTFTGNGNTDGVFVYCGFKPAWVLFKRSASTSDWVIWDSTRNTYNPLGDSLAPNTALAEASTPNRFDFVSNGFKMRTTAFPNDGTAKIFVAFAENPFGGSGVSPATAR